MKRLMIVLVLTLAGCSGVVMESCEDAGQPAIVEDAGTDAGPPAPPGLEPEQLCALAAQLEACNLDCPFVGTTSCDERRVLRCLWLLKVQGGDCGPSDLSILRSADCTEACR